MQFGDEAEGFRRPERVFDGRTNRPYRKKPAFDYAVNMMAERLDYPYYASLPPLIAQPDKYNPRLHGMLPLPRRLSAHMVSSCTAKCAVMRRNKKPCVIHCLGWYPDGRMLLTGTASGEFTLWSAINFSFVTIRASHFGEEGEDAMRRVDLFPVRCLQWSHHGRSLASGDDQGGLKLWTAALRDLHALDGHHSATIRGISFAPGDEMFVSASEDGRVNVFDHGLAKKEVEVRRHGAEIRCCDWHPTMSLIALGGKDHLIEVWDPMSKDLVGSLRDHKNTVNRVHWNKNGNWLLSASADRTARVFDIRTGKELQTFFGHETEISSCNWHPIHENLFVTCGFDGSMRFWEVGLEQPLVEVEHAHDAPIWDVEWHPLGHCMATGGGDRTTRFWIRDEPGSEKEDMGSKMFDDEEEEGLKQLHESMRGRRRGSMFHHRRRGRF